MSTERITDENMVALVKAILALRPNHSATLLELFEIVPDTGCLSSADRQQSASRGEELWRQTLRSVFAHTCRVEDHGALRLWFRALLSKLRITAPHYCDGLERDGLYIRLMKPADSRLAKPADPPPGTNPGLRRR